MCVFCNCSFYKVMYDAIFSLKKCCGINKVGRDFEAVSKCVFFPITWPIHYMLFCTVLVE